MSRAAVSLLTLALAGAAFSGCLDESPDPIDDGDAGVGVPGTLLEKALGVVVDNVTQPTAEDWFTIATATGPEGALAGFVWTVPPNATRPDAFFEDDLVVPLEIVPLLGENATGLQDWGLFIFLIQNGTAHNLLTLLAPTIDVRGQGPLGGPSGSIPAAPASTFASLGVESGDQVGFVLAARTADAAEAGAAIRVLDHDPDFDEQPSESITDFLENVGNGTGRSLPPTGTGSGFQFGLYIEFNTLGSGFVASTPSINVENDLPVDAAPVVSTRDLTLSSHEEAAAGWSLGLGLYIAFDSLGAGTWSVDADQRGTQMAGRSVFFNEPTFYGTLAGWILLGLPLYFLEAGGEGGSDVAFHLTYANVDVLEILEMFQIDLGVPLETLLGAEAGSGGFVFTGLLGDVPPAYTTTLDGNTLLTTSSQGPEIILQGLPARGT